MPWSGIRETRVRVPTDKPAKVVSMWPINLTQVICRQRRFRKQKVNMNCCQRFSGRDTRWEGLKITFLKLENLIISIYNGHRHYCSCTSATYNKIKKNNFRVLTILIWHALIQLFGRTVSDQLLVSTAAAGPYILISIWTEQGWRTADQSTNIYDVEVKRIKVQKKFRPGSLKF